MKITNKYLALMLMTLSIISCKNSNSEEDEHSESEGHHHEEGHEDGHTEDEGEKVMLSAQQFEALQIKIDTLQRRNMSGYVEANGHLEVPPQNEATITAITGANVASIEVIEGDQVKKNDVLIYLSHPSIIQIQSDYLNAYSKSQFLALEFKRQKKLYDAGVASGMNYQKATANYQSSTAMVNGLKAQLKQYHISVNGVQNGTVYQRVALRSPIDGFVEKVMVRIGQFVEPQTNLIEIVDTHHVHADLMVFEKDVTNVKKGQKVRFAIQSRPDKKLTAEIYSVSKTFEQNPKAVHVHAEIQNKDGDLIPGMYIQGRIEVDAIQTIAMPENSISMNGNQAYIFQVLPEGDDWKFIPVEVILGKKDSDWVAVRFMNEPEPNTKFAYNNAYYLMAEMKKGDAEHSH